MDYQKAQSYWDEKDKNNIVMPKEELLIWLNQFLKSHNTLALATGTSDFIDCTPIEYNYVNGFIYLFTEGGHKFIGLEKNKNVSMAIFEPYEGFGNIHSVQLFGFAEFIQKESDEYLKLTDYKKIPRNALPKIDLYLLKIQLKKAQILCSDFKKKGYSNRQEILFSK